MNAIVSFMPTGSSPTSGVRAGEDPKDLVAEALPHEMNHLTVSR